jgi:glycosyltransferase involved in cell wall biosynthesis
MSNHVVVSVIIPTFNCLSFLPQCIASIDKQLCEGLEIIIVDDGSTDGSQDYLASLSTQRDDITVLFKSKLGPGGARNAAVDQARGEWLAFLDADDLWREDKINKQLTFMRANPRVVFTFTNYEHVQEHTLKPITSCFSYWPEFRAVATTDWLDSNFQSLPSSTSVLFKENVVGTSSVMCRRDAYLQVQGFDTNLPSASDWDLWLKLSRIGEVAFTNSIMMDYLMRSGSVSKNLKKRIKAMETITSRFLTFARSQDASVERSIKSRLGDAYAEVYKEENLYWKSLKQHTQNFLNFPTSRRLKLMARSVFLL